jgi:hypothetical protein
MSVNIQGNAGDLVAPCGCVLVTKIGPSGENIVTLIPHDPDCETAKAAIAYANAQGKNVSVTMGIEGDERVLLHHTMKCAIYTTPLADCSCGTVD